MKKIALALVAGSLFAGVAAPAFAEAGDVLVRLRAISINPEESRTATINTLGVNVSNQVVPELDLTYFVTKNLAAELILGTARHELKSGGTSLGKISHLPPTVTLQWHFNPEGQIRPYVGAGLNYTFFYDNDLKFAGKKLDVESGSFGGALQAGVDIGVTKDVFVNVDVKKIWIDTDVKLDGAKIGNLGINPWVFGVGVGMKF